MHVVLILHIKIGLFGTARCCPAVEPKIQERAREKYEENINWRALPGLLRSSRSCLMEYSKERETRILLSNVPCTTNFLTSGRDHSHRTRSDWPVQFLQAPIATSSGWTYLLSLCSVQLHRCVISRAKPSLVFAPYDVTYVFCLWLLSNCLC